MANFKVASLLHAHSFDALWTLLVYLSNEIFKPAVLGERVFAFESERVVVCDLIVAYGTVAAVILWLTAVHLGVFVKFLIIGNT